MRHYQHFVWFTLGLAVLAGLSGEGFGSPDTAAASRPQARLVAAKPAVLATMPAPAALTPETGEADPAAEPEVPAADLAALADPSRRFGGKGGAGPVRTGQGGPTPAQIDRLVASSRERSGSADQGDEATVAS